MIFIHTVVIERNFVYLALEKRKGETMQPKRYLVWSTSNIELSDPFQRLWYLRQVLTHGRSEDIAACDWEEVRRSLLHLNLPADVQRLWENYFAAQG
jgi:hypothetical protein